METPKLQRPCSLSFSKSTCSLWFTRSKRFQVFRAVPSFYRRPIFAVLRWLARSDRQRTTPRKPEVRQEALAPLRPS